MNEPYATAITVLEGEPALPILVAVDNSPHSIVALHMAAALASTWGRDLLVLYVEDVNLLRMAGLPFCHEIGSYTAAVRILDEPGVEAGFRAARRRVEAISRLLAEKRGVHATVEVVRAPVLMALQEVAGRGVLLAVGRTGQSPGRRVGATASALIGSLRELGRPLLVAGAHVVERPEVGLIWSGSAASARALEYARKLSAQSGWALSVAVVGAEVTVVDAEAAVARVGGVAELERFIQGSDNLLVLPADLANLAGSAPGTVILVP